MPSVVSSRKRKNNQFTEAFENTTKILFYRINNWKKGCKVCACVLWQNCVQQEMKINEKPTKEKYKKIVCDIKI